MSPRVGFQRGGFALGLVVGLLIGLVLALGVALYITKAPVPFIDKVPQRTAEQDSAEAARNKNWDPNAALGGLAAQRAASAAQAAQAGSGPAPATAPAAAGLPATAVAPAASVPPARPVRDPAAILAGQAPAPAAARPAVAPASATAAAADAFVYFVQAGAYTRSDDAEQQKARLAMGGWTAKVSEREQAGRTVWRVRIGPYPTRAEADAQQQKLVDQGIEAQIVRVEKT
jgi:cell division protein FtsN